MSFNQRLLSLQLADRHQQPPSFAMVATPPEENELCLEHYDSKPEQENQDHARLSRENTPIVPAQREDPMTRIYRFTPIPTIVLDATMHVIQVSDSHCEFSKQTRENILNASIYEIPPRMIPVPDIATLSGALLTAITSKAVQVIDHIYLTEMKSYISLRMTPIYENGTLIYVVLEAQNVTKDDDETKSRSQHAYINETYRILLDTVKDYAIFMLDSTGNIATWNPGAAILKGYSTSEIIGQHFSVFYSRDDRIAQKPAKELEVCLRDGKVEDEGWRYRKDGSRFWANVMITPIYQFGRHVGFVKVTRDLTERKAAEARLIAAFEESSKLKSDFLANMSHEIRTPMNGMTLALTMLTSTELNEEQREYASIIEDSTSILLQVINDVLDYSKLSSGSFSLNSDVLNIENVIGAVVRNCKSSLKAGVELISFIPTNFPKHVKGDPLRYRQVLQNLVGNAVKFTETGNVKIYTSFTVDEQDPELWDIMTEVVDTGIGVPERAISTLFTPFTRFADSAKRQYQGTGLGLSICKSLAELMDGSVGFRPNPDGQGSVFWFTSKMGRTDVTSYDKPASVPGIDESFDPSAEIKKIAHQKRILLVEDNMVNQMVMMKLLNSLGFERVDTAWDGAEAVRLVRQTPLSYNIILMDISMPVLDGLEATSLIRKMNADVPIIALTGNALKGDAETYLAKGMNDYIAKPIHRKQLVTLLWKWMGT